MSSPTPGVNPPFSSVQYKSYHTAASVTINERQPQLNNSTPQQEDISSLGTSIFPNYHSFVEKFRSPINELYGFITIYFKCMWHLISPHEILLTADQSFYWRRSLMWSKENGSDLQTYMISKYANSSLLAGLLLTAEIAVLFSPSPPAHEMRTALKAGTPPLQFTIGLILVTSIFLTIGSIIACFTAWSTVAAISDVNCHAVLRSSVGMYTTHLPVFCLSSSIITFICWMCLFLFDLMPFPANVILISISLIFIIHIITTFSVFGRIILHSNAMSDVPIFDVNTEENMVPLSLFESLYEKSLQNKDIPAAVQYRLHRHDEWRDREKTKDGGNLSNISSIFEEETPTYLKRKSFEKRGRFTVSPPVPDENEFGKENGGRNLTVAFTDERVEIDTSRNPYATNTSNNIFSPNQSPHVGR